jgi:hypothetical protein
MERAYLRKYSRPIRRDSRNLGRNLTGCALVGSWLRGDEKEGREHTEYTFGGKSG